MKWVLFCFALFLVTAGVWYMIKPVSAPYTPPPPSCKALQIVTPQKNEKINSPLSLKVIVDNTKDDCRWTVFEAQAGTVQLQDGSGKVLGEGVLTTKEDWMQKNPVTYTASIDFVKSKDQNVTLLITEENPSGKPDAKILSLPLKQN